MNGRKECRRGLRDTVQTQIDNNQNRMKLRILSDCMANSPMSHVNKILHGVFRKKSLSGYNASRVTAELNGFHQKEISWRIKHIAKHLVAMVTVE